MHMYKLISNCFRPCEAKRKASAMRLAGSWDTIWLALTGRLGYMNMDMHMTTCTCYMYMDVHVHVHVTCFM